MMSGFLSVTVSSCVLTHPWEEFGVDESRLALCDLAATLENRCILGCLSSTLDADGTATDGLPSPCSRAVRLAAQSATRRPRGGAPGTGGRRRVAIETSGSVRTAVRPDDRLDHPPDFGYAVSFHVQFHLRIDPLWKQTRAERRI